MKFKSGLADEQVRATIEQRAPQLRALPGLVQKYYVREPATGEYAGIYFWESEAALHEFRNSDLARSIPGAYEVIGAPRVEILEVLFPLRGARRRPIRLSSRGRARRDAGPSTARSRPLTGASRPRRGFAPSASPRPPTPSPYTLDQITGDWLPNQAGGRGSKLSPPAPRLTEQPPHYPELTDIKGQGTAKWTLEIAAAGSHNLLLIGPPGAGKSMLAARLPGLLPPLDPAEILGIR